MSSWQSLGKISSFWGKLTQTGTQYISLYEIKQNNAILLLRNYGTFVATELDNFKTCCRMMDECRRLVSYGKEIALFVRLLNGSFLCVKTFLY
jgi:hypothetical protein